MLEDWLLVCRFNQGDKNAFQRIYEKYRSDLIRVALSLLNNKDAVEDVLHDVFVSFAQGCGSFRLRGSLKGFLSVCVANRARDVNRTEGRRAGRLGKNNDVADPAEPDHTHAVINRETAQKLDLALKQLPFEQREAIVLHLQHQMRFREIALIKGLSINTIMSQYRYGLDKLRSSLDGEL